TIGSCRLKSTLLEKPASPKAPLTASLPKPGCCGPDGIRTRTFQLDRLMCSRYTRPQPNLLGRIRLNKSSHHINKALRSQFGNQKQLVRSSRSYLSLPKLCILAALEQARKDNTKECH